MAKSPEQSAATSEIIRYDLGWKAINSLLRSGRSLSGHERNCCFLNTGGLLDTDGSHFANVSAAAALDLDDDGRVLALADWDYDGDIDFWIANRSGPQVRFLRNGLGGDQHFVAFKLEGVRCNRDAIGARITLYLDNHRPSLQRRTLRAGDGYLSQSSKWLHFGLGNAKRITRVVVRWPNGHVQSYHDVAADQWYRIREGNRQEESWPPPQGLKPLAPSELVAPPVTDQARIVLLAPVPLPDLTYTDSHNNDRQLTGNSSGARVVNLWATWCQSCLRELEEWREFAGEFEKAGLRIVTVNVDQPDDRVESGSPLEKVTDVLDRLQLPFENGFGSEDLAAKLDVLQRSLLSRQRPLPLPSSFLIDQYGRLRVVYKGPVTARTLLRDAELIKAGPDQILAAATSLAGRWLSPPGGSTPLQVALTFIEGGYVDEAQDYIRSLIQQSDVHPEYLSASLLNLHGAMLSDKKEYGEAVAAFSRALTLEPGNRQAHIELGGILLGMGKGAEAAPHFEEVLIANRDDPEIVYMLGVARMQQGNSREAKRHMRGVLRLRPHPLAHWQLGNIHLDAGDVGQAIAEYDKALTLKPDLVRAANNLAWLLATIADDNLRNGKRAVEIAEQLCKSANPPAASHLDTLAAAYAEAGRFDDAVRTATKAIELARNDKNAELTARIRNRLKLYRQGKPFHEELEQ